MQTKDRRRRRAKVFHAALTLAAAGFLLTLASAALAEPVAELPGSIELRAAGPDTRVVFVDRSGREALLRATTAGVSGERLVHVPDAGVLFSSWDEAANGASEHYVSITLDAGGTWSRPQALTFQIPLRAGLIVPGEAVPRLIPELAGAHSDRLFIVQFETTGLEAWRRMIRSLGAEVLSYLPEHAHIVRMDPALVPAVSGLPFVRWVGRYEPGYKIEPAVLAEILAATACGAGEPRRYHLQAFEAGPVEKAILAAEVRGIGGRVELETPNGSILDATLTHDQVLAIARSQHLLWLDRWSPPENDMDIVRQQCGADYVESVGGYSGQGVSGEVMDGGVMQTHQDFDGISIHGPSASSDSHGTCTYGIVFGNGGRDGDGVAKATGNLPSAQGWFYDYDNLADRYQETADLVQAPIYASFQSNSWGGARTRSYTSVSSEMDDIIWQYDIPIFQSQSNAGNQDSRPQAWAKNIISIGGVNHYDTATLSDDCWCYSGSIGPAEDGRIKPDLCYWYDWEYTTDLEPGGYTSGLYYDNFGGTSGATPITAGIGGLILQMWADNILGNDPQGTTVFEKRPHSSTTKALMINTAEQYDFTGVSHDLTRMHQGWGLPSARRFYERAPLIRVVDETEVLQELDTHPYSAAVPAGQGELKVTLVTTDRAGTTSSTLHRINDVTLKVTDPSGAATWWGNYGLDSAAWSVAGGSADATNTVENVFIQNPEPGNWTIEVSADDLNMDEHAETPEVDQDYALVVYGVSSLSLGCASPPPPATNLTATASGDNRVDLAWLGTATARQYRIYRSFGGCAGTYVRIGTVPKTQTTFTDANASGGTAYGYVVRAIEACEAPDSNCAEATATGTCLLAPSFAGIGSATGDNAAACGVTLSWPAAVPSCSGPLVYNVYRGTSQGFAPTSGNRVASCVPGTTWHDTRALSSDTTYYYIVRAEDLGGGGSAVCGGAPETNTIAQSTFVQGPTSVLMDEGFETGLNGWTASKGTPPAKAGDWIAGDPVGTFVGAAPAQPEDCAAGAQCLFTGVSTGGPARKGDVDAGEVLATSPAFDASSFETARLTLSRWHYNSATQNDLGDYYALYVSSNDGASWTSLEKIGPLTSVNQWTPVAFDLQSSVTLTSQMKLQVRSADGTLVDTVVESAIDSVHIEGATACTTQAPGAPGDTADGSLRVTLEGSGVRLMWGADCGGGTGYGLYRGDLDAGYSSLAPVPGCCGLGATSVLIDPGPGSQFFLVAPNDGSAEGSLGRGSDGSLRPQPSQTCYPRAIPVNACAP